jgi:DUF4097 and DUF4098 domain-containing protein YvlB
MKGRTILIIVLAIVLLGVCALCALTIFSGYAWLQIQPGGISLSSANVSAQVTETRSFEVSGPASLEINSAAGSITVTAAEVENIEVDVTRTAWAANKADAQAAAEALAVTFNQSGDQVDIRYEMSEKINLIGNQGGTDSVDFTVRVPAETSVTLQTSFGKVSLTGTTGDAELSGSFGDLTATDVTGALIMKGAQSVLIVNGVNSGSSSVTLDTAFGEVQVSGLAGGQVRIGTSNGPVTLRDITASAGLEITNQFGDVTLEEFSAESVTITNSNGPIKISAGTIKETLQVTNAFGDVTVRETSAAAYELATDNGKLSLDGGQGPLTLTNQFGDIIVTQAEQAILSLSSTNGRISFSGTLDPASAQTIENSFGDIELTIPADSTFDIDLETEFGEIDSDLPITVSGSLSQNKLQGALNGGGQLLKASTSNGKISLNVLAESK